MTAGAALKSKPKMVAIDATLHGYISVLASLLNADRAPGESRIGIKDVLDRAGWEVVREHRNRLAAAMGKPLDIPEPGQLTFAGVGGE